MWGVCATLNLKCVFNGTCQRTDRSQQTRIHVRLQCDQWCILSPLPSRARSGRWDPAGRAQAGPGPGGASPPRVPGMLCPPLDPHDPSVRGATAPPSVKGPHSHASPEQTRSRPAPHKRRCSLRPQLSPANACGPAPGKPVRTGALTGVLLLRHSSRPAPTGACWRGKFPAGRPAPRTDAGARSAARTPRGVPGAVLNVPRLSRGAGRSGGNSTRFAGRLRRASHRRRCMWKRFPEEPGPGACPPQTPSPARRGRLMLGEGPRAWSRPRTPQGAELRPRAPGPPLPCPGPSGGTL